MSIQLLVQIDVYPTTHIDSQLTAQSTSPLQSLHSSSFSTLTELSYDVITFLAEHDEQDCVIIQDPYVGLCDALPNFVSLESLNVGVVLQGDLDVDINTCCGTQWGVLCDVLTAPGEFLKLKEVEISVTVKPEYGPNAEAASYRASRTIAKLFAGCILFSVRPQFRALEDLCTAGCVDFVFTVATRY